MKTKMMVAFVCINFLHTGNGAMVHTQTVKLHSVKQPLAKSLSKDLTEILFFAAERNHTGDIEELFSGEIIPDVTAKNKAGHKLLDEVVFWGNAEVIPFLVVHGVDVNERAANGRPPLIEALFSLRPKKVMLSLIAAGARLNTKDKQGMTALMWAALKEPACVPVLIGAGADITITNEYDDNKCARDYAQDKAAFDRAVTVAYENKQRLEKEKAAEAGAKFINTDADDYEVVEINVSQ